MDIAQADYNIITELLPHGVFRRLNSAALSSAASIPELSFPNPVFLQNIHIHTEVGVLVCLSATAVIAVLPRKWVIDRALGGL
jgi:hypothetical protein